MPAQRFLKEQRAVGSAFINMINKLWYLTPFLRRINKPAPQTA